MSQDFTMEALRKDPSRYGFCSFEDFKKNPAKWRTNPEQIFDSVAKAGTAYKQYIHKMKYEIEGYSCDTLEKVQNVARQMGLREKDLDIRVLISERGGQKVDMTVRFFTKDELSRRMAW